MYKVNCIAIALKNQKTAKYGELVDAKQLEGNVDDLVDTGFVIKASKEEILEHKNSNGKGKDNGLDLNKPVSKMTTAELEAKAKELNVDISKAKTNPERAKIIQDELDSRHRESLEQEAKTLGLDFDEKTSDEDLANIIEKAKQKD